MSPSLRPLLAALSFLTTLPVPGPSSAQAAEDPGLFGRSFAWFPLAGLILGGLLAVATWLLGWTGLALPVQAGLLLLLWVLLTGGLHLDGLMDACDGLFAPVPPERRLAIMADVHPGAFGVLGVVLLLGLKWALLVQLLESPLAWMALLLAPSWGRWSAAWAAQRFPYGRAGDASLGSTLRQGLTVRQLRIASATMLILQVLLLLVRWESGGALLGPLLGPLLARWAAARLGGGLTGDVYGALVEVVELGALLGLAML